MRIQSENEIHSRGHSLAVMSLNYISLPLGREFRAVSIDYDALDLKLGLKIRFCLVIIHRLPSQHVCRRITEKVN